MSSPPFECVPCEAKIVLDGGSASKLIEAACEAFQHYFSRGYTFTPEGFEKIIRKLNELETGAIELQKLQVHYTGYKGELPPHLKS
jgi:hypothetical protein